MEMTTIKTVAVFAVIFGCFIALYPRVFHPMLLHAFGMTSKRPSNDEILKSNMPPHLRANAEPGKPHAGDDTTKRIKSGPHPGMRAMGETRRQMASQQSQGGGGGGGGMMGVVLPMYAIGIVVYLVYTLSKVFGRGQKTNNNKDYLENHFSNVGRQGKPSGSNYSRSNGNASSEPNIGGRNSKGSQKELEKLLDKADKDNISELELQQLKQRLMDTEAQMMRLLQAMEVAQKKTSEMVGEVIKKEGEEEEEEEELVEEEQSGDVDLSSLINSKEQNGSVVGDSLNKKRYGVEEENPVSSECRGPVDASNCLETDNRSAESLEKIFEEMRSKEENVMEELEGRVEEVLIESKDVGEEFGEDHPDLKKKKVPTATLR